jgi:penicillin amidase
MFQMDYSRRQAQGTLAELLGPPRSPPTSSSASSASAARPALPGRDLARELPGAQAYSAGVNAWIASNPAPPEYTALELTTVQPWFPVDCIAVAKLIAFGLSFDLDTSNTVALLTYTQVGQAAGLTA